MKYSILKIFALTTLLAASCSKDDAPADARLPFVGQFKANDHVVTAETTTEKVKRTVLGGTKVEIRLVQKSTTEIQMDLKGLVEDIIVSLESKVYTYDFENLSIALVSGNSFELKKTNFKMNLAGDFFAECSIKGEGTLQGNTLLLEYEFLFTNYQDVLITFTGEMELIKSGQKTE